MNQAPNVIQELALVGTRLCSNFSDILVKQLGIGINEWRVLNALNHRKQVKISDICREAGIHKTVVSRALQALEQKHLIYALRERRYVTVSINENGIKALDDSSIILNDAEKKFLALCSQSEAIGLYQILRKISNTI